MLSIALAAVISAQPIAVTRIQTFDSLKPVAFATGPKSAMFAAALENGQVRLMNAATKATTQTLTGHPQACYALSFTPNGQQIVSGDETSRMYVWDVKTGKKLREFPRGVQSHARGIQAISFSPDGKTMYSTGKDDVIIVWNFADAKPKYRIAGNGVVFASAVLVKSNLIAATLTEGIHYRGLPSYGISFRKDFTGGTGINDLVANAAGTRVITAGRDNFVGVWDVAKKSLIAKLGGHQDWVQRVAISPNGKLAASSANDRTVRFWDLNSNKQVAILNEASAIGSPIAFTGDGKYVVTVSINDGLQINSVTPSQAAVVSTRRR